VANPRSIPKPSQMQSRRGSSAWFLGIDRYAKKAPENILKGHR
jgi:hypothetical protein